MKVKVREVMTWNVETISPAATLEEAAKKMKADNVGLLAVAEGDGIVGVVTDRDIVLRAVSERLRPEMSRVRDIMTRDVVSCYDDEDIAEASLLMEKNLLHRLIVLDRNERLRGVISLSDIAAKAKSRTLSGYVLAKVSAA